MYEERKAVEAEYGINFDDVETAFSETALGNGIERMNRTYDGYLESARGTLSESQVQQFEIYMQSRREMMEMSIKMAQQMYGGESTAL